MRKHMSVLSLWVGSTFLFALLVSAAAGAAQLALLALRLPEVTGGRILTFEFFYLGSHADILYFIGIVMVAAKCLRCGCSARQSTLGRLSVGDGMVTVWHAISSAGCLAVFWGVETAVVILGYLMFRRAADPMVMSRQSLFLAVSAEGLLHWLMPIEDRYTRAGVAVMIAGLGLAVAVDAAKFRRGGRNLVSSFLLLALAVVGPIAWQGVLTRFVTWAECVVVAIEVIRLYLIFQEEAERCGG